MGKGSFLAIIAACVSILIMATISIRDINGAVSDNEYLRLTQTMNKASDAALTLALESNNVSGEDTVINPYLCSEVFYKVIMESYRISDTERNRQYIYSKVPLIGLVVNDGIYLGYAKNGIYDNTAREHVKFVWTDKMPFTYENGAKVYAMTIDGENIKSISIPSSANPVGGNISGIDPGNKIEFNDSLPIGDSDRRMKVTSRIVEIFTGTIQSLNRENPSKKIFIPSELNSYKTVAIEGPTLMAIVQDFDMKTTKPINKFSIAATQTIENSVVVGYTESGKRKYCYADQYDGDVANIEKAFTSFKAAAKEGYNPDLNRVK